MSLWKRYVDDTFAFVKSHLVNNVLSELNNFHKNMFTIEMETDFTFPFLNVKIKRLTDGNF